MIYDDIYSIKKYLINLDKRKDRLITTTELLSKKGYYNIERVSAVEGKKLSSKAIKHYVDESALEPIYKNVRTEHYQLSIGAIGCSLSHFQIWKKFLLSNEKQIMIFEDDTFPTITSQELSFYLQYVPEDWDIILCGGIYNNLQPINPYVNKIYTFFCTHAYIINKNKLKFLLDNALPMSKQIDSWLSDLSVDGTLNIYGLNTDWMQNPDINDTDIQTEMKIIQPELYNSYYIILIIYVVLILINVSLLCILFMKFCDKN
jgi:GR25 family glycosyltransferase involved in LPS biosynthesis